MQVGTGKSILNGIAIGKLKIYKKKDTVISAAEVADTAAEEARFEDARAKAIDPADAAALRALLCICNCLRRKIRAHTGSFQNAFVIRSACRRVPVNTDNISVQRCIRCIWIRCDCKADKLPGLRRGRRLINIHRAVDSKIRRLQQKGGGFPAFRRRCRAQNAAYCFHGALYDFCNGGNISAMRIPRKAILLQKNQHRIALHRPACFFGGNKNILRKCLPQLVRRDKKAESAARSGKGARKKRLLPPFRCTPLCPFSPLSFLRATGICVFFRFSLFLFLFHTLISLSKCHKNMPPEVVGRQYHIFYSAVCAESEALSDSEEAEPAPLSASVSAAALVSDPEEEDCSELIVSSSFARPSLNAFS